MQADTLDGFEESRRAARTGAEKGVIAGTQWGVGLSGWEQQPGKCLEP